MFKRIAVGGDEHEGSLDAIAQAKNLLAGDGELTLAHVLAHGGHGYLSPGAAYEASGGSAQHNCLKGCGSSRRPRVPTLAGDRFNGARTARAVRGDRSRPARSAVISPRVTGAGSDWGDTRAALDGAPCAIGIAPTNYAREPAAMREIGVGYNGALESKHALELGAVDA